MLELCPKAHYAQIVSVPTALAAAVPVGNPRIVHGELQYTDASEYQSQAQQSIAEPA